MIVDRILDRKESGEYNAHDFYFEVFAYGEIGHRITEAMDYGENEDVQRELCRYIDENEYNPEIKKYINSVAWL